MTISVRESIQHIQAPGQRVIPVLDHDTWEEAEDGLSQYGDVVEFAKVNSLADLVGVPQVIRNINRFGLRTFVDYKLHDVDETMRKRARNLTLIGASIITLHALADTQAMEAAIKGVDEALGIKPGLARPLILAVTVLTSHKEERCEELFGAGREAEVKKLAHIGADVIGIDGLICSPREAEMLRKDSKTKDMVLVLPAVRPEFAIRTDEQAATATTPKIAIEAGGDLLVVGRPLIESLEYGLTAREAFDIITQEVAQAIK